MWRRVYSALGPSLAGGLENNSLPKIPLTS
jgi:hypothetical protein